MSIISRIFQKRPGFGVSKSRGRRATPRLEMLETRALLAVYTVVNTLDGFDDVGSLRYALRQANFETKGLDFINFNIPNPGVEHTIVIGAQLFLNDQVVIDGTTQPGYAGQPLIYVETRNPATSYLFEFRDNPGGPLGPTTSTGSTIQGLGMYSFPVSAVAVFPESTYNYIQNNWIGFRPNGVNAPSLTAGAFPSADGVVVQSSFTVVRGNTISGVRDGVVIGGGVTNAIQGNNIGTDPSGSGAENFGYRNTRDGIHLIAGARQNFLGPDNVLSGNRYGIHLSHSTNTGNIAFRNKIGTNKAGNAAIGNRELGILLASGTTYNALGGYYDGDSGNLIAGNAKGGIGLAGASANWVQKNVFGLSFDRNAAIRSPGSGLVVSGGEKNVIEENILATHVENGIYMTNTQANYLRGNFVGRNESGTLFPNGGFGIALDPGANFNYVLTTAYGSNGRGNLRVDPAAVGNVF